MTRLALNWFSFHLIAFILFNPGLLSGRQLISEAADTSKIRSDLEGLSLERYLVLDTDLHNDVYNLSFSTVEVGNARTLKEANISRDIPDEEWERLGSAAAAFPVGSGSVLVDDDGKLRLYYMMRFPRNNDEIEPLGAYNRQALALLTSEDDGETWQKAGVNAYRDLIDHPESNLLYVPKPTPEGTIGGIQSASVYFDSNSDPREQYKIVYRWYENEYNGTYIATSEDGFIFSDPVQVIERVSGDNNPDALFYDSNHQDWVIFGRGRGRPSGRPASNEGPPKPYFDTRWAYMAISKNGYDSQYDVTEQVIDPAVIYNYGDDADGGESVWREIDTSICGDRWVPDRFIGRSRPGYYMFPVVNYFDQYISIVPVYFWHDDRSPFNDDASDRTDGPLYPVWGHARVRDQYSVDYTGTYLDQQITGVEGGWKFPMSDKPAIDLTDYNRRESNICSSVPYGADGRSLEVGQVFTQMKFAVSNGKMVIPASVTSQYHYDNVYSDIENTRKLVVHRTEEDRFAQFSATDSEGFWITVPIKVPAGATDLLVNADINESLHVSVLNDESAEPIQGFTRSESQLIQGNDVNHVIKWSAHSVIDLRGELIKFKFYLTDGKMFSFRFLSE